MNSCLSIAGTVALALYIVMGFIVALTALVWSFAETKRGLILQPIFCFLFWPLIALASYQIDWANRLADFCLEALDRKEYKSLVYNHGVLKIGRLVAFRGATMFELQYRRLIVTLNRPRFCKRYTRPWLRVRLDEKQNKTKGENETK